jgi:hypothetical protein
VKHAFALHTGIPALALLAGLAGTAPSTAAAQVAGSTRKPDVGQRVRIIAPTLRRDRFVGTVEALPPDSILLDTAGVHNRLGFETGPVLVEQYRRVTIPLSMIDGIDVSVGKTFRRSTIKGALIGAVSGAFLLGAGNLPEVNPRASDFVKGMPTGAIVGTVIGGALGYLLAGERWSTLFRAPPR